jgi:FAD/FMN-containing dehydrogenase
VQNALIAENLSQAEHFWRIREQISGAQKALGKNIKHDVSVPISAIAQFIERTDAALVQKFHGIQTVVFGHIGDGNVHFNVSAGTAFADSQSLMANESAINQIVYEQVRTFNGSISAEHGMGLLKRDFMSRIKSEVELQTMHSIKKTLDPKNLMNPHKIFNDN